MLRIHVVREGRHGYYLDDLVPGRAEGALVAGEPPGTWSGPGSASLGLHGTVDADRFTALMNGSDPATGRMLRGWHGRSSVAGYDLTFCAPKSVSLLHALAPREIAGEVGAGHRAAVDEASGYLSRQAVGVRRRSGDGGGMQTRIPSTGMVAGDFLHRTSRALDPHLHTHVVAANVAEGVDGVWSAVDSRRVFAHVGSAGSIYQARLRLELSDRLGVGWEVRPSGLGDVVGVGPGLRRLFSQRSAAIEEYLAVHGGLARGVSPGRAKYAADRTRPAKDHSRTVESLVPEWRSRAADFGHDLGDLVQVVGRGRALDPASSGPGLDVERLADGLAAVAGQGSSLARRDVVGMVAASSVRGASARTVESVADRVVRSIGSPGLEGNTGAGHGVLEPRWSTDDVLRTVREYGDQLVAGIGVDVERRTGSDRGAVVERGRAADRGQRQAPSGLLRHDRAGRDRAGDVGLGR